MKKILLACIAFSILASAMNCWHGKAYTVNVGILKVEDAKIEKGDEVVLVKKVTFDNEYAMAEDMAVSEI